MHERFWNVPSQKPERYLSLTHHDHLPPPAEASRPPIDCRELDDYERVLLEQPATTSPTSLVLCVLLLAVPARKVLIQCHVMRVQ
jgi:hypothetical protein